MPPEASLPFEYSQCLWWVKIQSPQSDRPLNFLFDSGAEVSVINADTAAVLGLQEGEKIQVHAVNATTAGRWPVSKAVQACSESGKMPGYMTVAPLK